MSRFWQLFLLLALFGVFYLGGCIAQNANAPKVIQAQEFKLVDEKGNLRGVLGMVDGNAGFVLYDDKGEVRGGFAVVDGNPMLTLHADKGMGGGWISVIDGKPTLAFADEKGNVIWSAP